MSTNSLFHSYETATKRYQVSFNISSFEHLCVARELSGFKLATFSYNERFDSWVEDDESKPFTPEDYLVFLDLMHYILTNKYSSSHKAYLFTMSTGEVTRWGYTRRQTIKLRPFMEMLPVRDTMIIHSDPDGTRKYSLDPNVDDDDRHSGVETVTMYNLNLDELRNTYTRPQVVTDILAVKPASSSPTTVPTTENIRNFLRSL